MKISRLIEALEDIKSMHGDLNIYIESYDSCHFSISELCQCNFKVSYLDDRLEDYTTESKGTKALIIYD